MRIAALTFVYAARAGVSLSSISLSGVYRGCLEFRITVASLGAVGYLVPWTGYVVNPMLIAFGLSKRSRVLVLAGICGQLLIFGLDGEKTFLFSPPVLLSDLPRLEAGETPSRGLSPHRRSGDDRCFGRDPGAGLPYDCPDRHRGKTRDAHPPVSCQVSTWISSRLTSTPCSPTRS